MKDCLLPCVKLGDPDAVDHLCQKLNPLVCVPHCEQALLAPCSRNTPLQRPAKDKKRNSWHSLPTNQIDENPGHNQSLERRHPQKMNPLGSKNHLLRVNRHQICCLPNRGLQPSLCRQVHRVFVNCCHQTRASRNTNSAAKTKECSNQIRRARRRDQQTRCNQQRKMQIHVVGGQLRNQFTDQKWRCQLRHHEPKQGNARRSEK
mmetsp:Transcript_75223/g.200821  ORF Transcript_75223/g.200821 Transcript_75223/m.200821 type:complete len:204 (+) Transcript_75223:2957-3568(+)